MTANSKESVFLVTFWLLICIANVLEIPCFSCWLNIKNSLSLKKMFIYAKIYPTISYSLKFSSNLYSRYSRIVTLLMINAKMIINLPLQAITIDIKALSKTRMIISFRLSITLKWKVDHQNCIDVTWYTELRDPCLNTKIHKISKQLLLFIYQHSKYKKYYNIFETIW